MIAVEAIAGGHTHAISRYGVKDLLPENVVMVHGPGCPVCVLPVGRIDMAIELALREKVILCTYADTMRVPASRSIMAVTGWPSPRAEGRPATATEKTRPLSARATSVSVVRHSKAP